MRHVVIAVLVVTGCDGVATRSNNIDERAEPELVTYEQDIAPIVQRNCAGCHTGAGIAPFSLETYEAVSERAQLIAYVTRERIMPPTVVDASGGCNTYSDALWLSDSEIEMLQTWADSGAAQGTPSQGHAPTGVEAVALTEPLVLPMPEVYTPNAAFADDYRCFVLDPQLESDQFVTGYEMVPGDAKVVHHVILYGLTSVAADATVAELDAAEPGPGYTCFGGPGVDEDITGLAGWAPGTPPTHYAEGTGMRIYGKRKIVMEIHYNLDNGARPDQTTARLQLEPLVDYEAFSVPTGSDVVLEPGQPEAEVSDSFLIGDFLPFPVDLRMHAVFPHMHKRGTRLRVEAIGPEETRCLVDVPRWDFHWQRYFTYTEPITVHPDDVIKTTCIYDTSNDTEPVYWGEGTDDEMCLAFFYVTL